MADTPLPSSPRNATIYVIDDIDFGPMVDDFIEDESEFYTMIQSYATNNSTILRILNGNGERISSAVLIPEYDEPVLEVKRPALANFETQSHSSIAQWYISVVGESDTYHTDMFSNVFIGDEKVPLSKILVSTFEEHEAEAEPELQNFTVTIKNDEYQNDIVEWYLVSGFMFVSLWLCVFCLYMALYPYQLAKH